MPKKPSLEDGAVPSISRMLHRAVQTAAELHAGIAGPGALTPRQHAILEAVAAEDGATQSQLVAATGVDRSTLAELVARLAERGLLERSRSTTDARAKQVRLTAAGRERLEAVRPAAAEVDQALLGRLPEDKRARFLKDLGRLIAVTPVAPAAEPAGKSGGKTKKKSKKSKKSGA